MFSTDKRRRLTIRGDLSRSKTVTLETGPRRKPQPRALVRILIASATALAITLVMSVGGPAFRYRLGERADREVRLKVELDIPNETKTRNEREEAADTSPLVFINSPQPNVDLRSRLLVLATAVAKQPIYEQLDMALRNEWKLTPETFKSLRSLLPNEAALPDFTAKLDRAFSPLLEYGVLDAQALPTDSERSPDTVAIYPIGSDQPLLRHKDEVQLATLARPGGALEKILLEQWPQPEEASAVMQLIVLHLRPTLVFDEERTVAGAERARQGVIPVIDRYQEGFRVVSQGGIITEEQLRLLREEHEKLWGRDVSLQRRSFHFLGLLAIVAMLFATTGFYLKAYEKKVAENPARLLTLCLLCLVTVGLARLLSVDPYQATVLPIAVASLLLAVAYNRVFALNMAFAMSLLVSLTQVNAMQQFVVLMGGTAVGILLLDSVRSRTKLIVVGLYSGLAYGGLSIAMALLTDQPWSLVFEDAARRFGSGLIAGFVISGCLPFIESLFGIVTDISLIELADTSHLLLQELVRRAPGTYNHSVTVSIIAEAAAKCIGCNSLLVRVGSLFHDVGKMLKPHYFIENKSENERNRHEQLAPAMSTLIIIGHVKDGADLGRQHHLPEPIIDLIEQHHGTTLVDYFFHEASREAKEAATPEESVEESAFRYPGPKPQSKEAAVLMLSDCVESASRTLSEPTPARIEKLVRNLSLNRLLDGQFNESGITLEEVKIIEDSLTKSLTSVYHGRVRYPAAS